GSVSLLPTVRTYSHGACSRTSLFARTPNQSSALVIYTQDVQRASAPSVSAPRLSGDSADHALARTSSPISLAVEQVFELLKATLEQIGVALLVLLFLDLRELQQQ